MAKRKLNAGGVAPTPEPPQQEESPGMGGMWGGTALNMLKQRLADTRESVAQGVMNGTLALELDPSQIYDSAGSDRVGDWKNDPEFQALLDNIKRRGQVQPIRVRPRARNWKPQHDHPLISRDEFVIQSGRRRLAVCEALGIKVKAVIATEEGDRALADLEERFHENTMRKNLNGFEELLSIGLIADALADLTQEELAERLGVPQGDVSLGRSCVELHDEILRSVDIRNTPKRQFRSIIPRLRAAAKGKPATDKASPVKVTHQATTVSVQPAKNGYAVKIKADKEIDPQWLAEQIARVIEARSVS